MPNQHGQGSRDIVMANWSAGYVVDVEYTHGFYQELTPSLLAFLVLLQGVQAPDLGSSSLAYCELGCGQGFSTNLLAAANPHIQFHATDFNPGHIVGAQSLAQAGRQFLRRQLRRLPGPQRPAGF
jgi:predicted O-methyltransferase YrrM